MRVSLAWLAIASGALAAPSHGSGLGAAIELPARARALRQAGVPADQVKVALQSAKAEGLHPDEAADVLKAEEDAPGDKLPNFGDFVHEQLEAGLRGRDLARSIHEEHQRLGIGHGHGPGGADEAGDGADAGADHGPPDDGQQGKGPPDGKGPEGEHGKESKGKAGKSKGGAP